MEEKGEVFWQEWLKDNFLRAQKENKLILLYISVSWSHACRVLEETAFGQKDICDLINNGFIPIRVNADRRPDINERYFFGDYPGITVLHSGGGVIKKTGWLPPPELKAFLSSIVIEANQINKDVPSKKPGKRIISGEIKNIKLHLPIVEDILKELTAPFSLKTGFGPDQKLPALSLLELCLDSYFFSCREGHRQLIFKTLEMIEMTELFDSVDGGFFRYSSGRSWKTPHFEKILEENARLVSFLLDAAKIFRQDKFKEMALRALKYTEKFLSRKEGGFGGSQEASRNYYILKATERSRQSPPFTDPTIYTQANALVVSAFLKAGDDHFRLLAIKTIDFLIHHCRNRQTGGMYHYFDGEPRVYGLLLDQTFMLEALINSYQYTNIRKYLELAEETAEFILKKFIPGDQGYFPDRLADENDFGDLKENFLSFREQSVLASNLIVLSYISEKEHYRNSAKKILTSLLSDYARCGIGAADYARGILRYIKEPLIITIIGPLKRKEDKELVTKALDIFHPSKIIRYQNNEKDLRGNLKVSAHVCLGTSGNGMVRSPDEFDKLLNNFY